MKAIVYQDLIDENLQGYQIKEVPDDQKIIVLRDGVILGLQGWIAPVHVTHLTDGNLFIIAQTNYELSIAKRKSIIKGAVRFYNQQGVNTNDAASSD